MNKIRKKRKSVEFVKSCRTCIYANFKTKKCIAPIPKCIFINIINPKEGISNSKNISYEEPFNFCKTWKTAPRITIRHRIKTFEIIVSSEEF